jgi:hypothetical protein
MNKNLTNKNLTWRQFVRKEFTQREIETLERIASVNRKFNKTNHLLFSDELVSKIDEISEKVIEETRKIKEKLEKETRERIETIMLKLTYEAYDKIKECEDYEKRLFRFYERFDISKEEYLYIINKTKEFLNQIEENEKNEQESVIVCINRYHTTQQPHSVKVWQCEICQEYEIKSEYNYCPKTATKIEWKN